MLIDNASPDGCGKLMEIIAFSRKSKFGVSTVDQDTEYDQRVERNRDTLSLILLLQERNEVALLLQSFKSDNSDYKLRYKEQQNQH